MITNVRELVSTIRACPGMYLGFYSVIRFKHFLDGYCFAKEENGDLSFGRDLRVGFQQKVAKRFVITNSQSWDNILVFVCGSEAAALDFFWTIWDQYISESKVEAEK